MERADIARSRHVIEPLDDWVLVQPAHEEESRGRLVLPSTIAQSRLERSIVLACGPAVTDLSPADVVLALSAQAIELRDGSKLVQRQYVVARVVD
jgi:co-chaperonin GroES (HSP10)